MAFPTDQGYVFITPTGTGMMAVEISTTPDVANAFAKYHAVSANSIDDSQAQGAFAVNSSGARYSKGPLAVSSNDGQSVKITSPISLQDD
ncbi:hypothetical protein [Blastococcus sp. Marseille-P5729]|uniref:hypothetical protein n=1 Tax=Blastococcus sp. Marseille-P5729 TaxID=2086582 RepID=UPI000D10A68A|nr:hypothetical protein [Blastococcus sp. Marseille-P5729]